MKRPKNIVQKGPFGQRVSCFICSSRDPDNMTVRVSRIKLRISLQILTPFFKEMEILTFIKSGK